MNNLVTSIKNLWIKYPNSTADKIIANLSEVYDTLMQDYLYIAFTCFGISVLIQLIQSLGDKEKDFSVGDLLIHSGWVLIGLYTYKAYFLTMTNFFNLFADKLYSLKELETFFDATWKRVIAATSFNLFTIDINEFVGSLMTLASMIAGIALFVARKILLSLLFLFGGLMLAISPLPIYGTEHIKKLLVNHIQISSWVTIHSGFLLVMSSWSSSTHTGTIEFLFMAPVYLIVTILVPTFAQLIFGGSNFMPVPFATNVVYLGAAKLGVKSGVVGNLGMGAATMASNAYNAYKNATHAGTSGGGGVGSAWLHSPSLSNANPNGGLLNGGK